jgi:Na+/citrate or Na+/malate symporter
VLRVSLLVRSLQCALLHISQFTDDSFFEILDSLRVYVVVGSLLDLAGSVVPVLNLHLSELGDVHVVSVVLPGCESH